MEQSIKYWTVPPDWAGQTAVIFASGPSLTQEQIDYVRGKGVRTIAINGTIEHVPWADVHYFADLKFWNWIKMRDQFPSYRRVREAYESFQGLKVTIAQSQTDALHLKRGFQRGLSHAADTLCTGNNSGYQAINLAFLFGAKRIILLGYDQKAATDGRTHHHRGHPRPTAPEVYDAMLQCWPFLAEAIQGKAEVINCTPGSRIECFTKMDLQEAV